MIYASEIVQIADWAEAEIAQKKVPEAYATLFQILHRNTQPNQQKAPFENEKERLLKALRSIDVTRLNQAQKEFLERIGLWSAIGEAGAKAVEDALVRHGLDIATAANRIQELMNQTQGALQRLRQLREALGDVVLPGTVEPSAAVVMRVRFDHEAAIKTIVDLKYWSKEWFLIGRGLASLAGSPPEDVRVIGAARGSLIVELAPAVLVAGLFVRVLRAAVALAHDIVDLKERLKGIANNPLVQVGESPLVNMEQLSEEIDKRVADAVEEKFSELIEDQEVKADGGVRKEAISAIKKLVQFLAKGGDIDMVVPSSATEQEGHAEDLKRIREEVKEIRNLLPEVRALLPHLRQDESGPAPRSEGDA